MAAQDGSAASADEGQGARQDARPGALKRWRHAAEMALVRAAIAVLRRLGPVRASNAMGVLCRTVGPSHVTARG